MVSSIIANETRIAFLMDTCCYQDDVAHDGRRTMIETHAIVFPYSCARCMRSASLTTTFVFFFDELNTMSLCIKSTSRLFDRFSVDFFFFLFVWLSHHNRAILRKSDSYASKRSFFSKPVPVVVRFYLNYFFSLKKYTLETATFLKTNRSKTTRRLLSVQCCIRFLSYAKRVYVV